MTEVSADQMRASRGFANCGKILGSSPRAARSQTRACPGLQICHPAGAFKKDNGTISVSDPRAKRGQALTVEMQNHLLHQFRNRNCP
jgi:hypothetical protein